MVQKNCAGSLINLNDFEYNFTENASTILSFATHENLNPGNDEENPVQYKRLRPTHDKNLDYVCFEIIYFK